MKPTPCLHIKCLIICSMLIVMAPCRSMPRPGEAPLFGYETYGLHVMAALSRKVYLPNLAMLYTPYDNHMFSRTADEPGPWFAYCGQPDRNNLLLPHTLEPSKASLLL